MMPNKHLFYQQNLVFWLITVNSLGYLTVLFLIFPKIFSSFLMQCLTLGNIQNYLTFSTNIVVGIGILYACLKICLGTLATLKKIYSTNQFLNNISTVNRQSDYLIYNSTHLSAFTAGYLFPKIYLSKALYFQSTSSELKAIVLHEQTHQINHDPLKGLIISFFNAITPYYPGKKSIFNHYALLVETTADEVAKTILNSNRPLLTALQKMLLSNSQLSIIASYFSATSVRLVSLIKNETLDSRRVVAGNIAIMALILILFTATTQTTVFVQCRHLTSCLSTIFHDTNCLH